MLDITILNDTLFPIFLFIIYFSLGCIAIHTQKDEKELDCKTTEDIISYSQILSPIFDEILEDIQEEEFMETMAKRNKKEFKRFTRLCLESED